MTIAKLRKCNAHRRRQGMPLLSGDRWDIKLCPSVGPIQSSIAKTFVYLRTRLLRRRDEKIAGLTDHPRFTNHGGSSLWVEKNNRPLDRVFQGRTLRSLQKLQPTNATPEDINVMREWLNR